jgi:hypothetical protein
MRAMHSNSPRPITTAGRRKKEARGAPGGTVAPRAVWPHSSLRSPVDPLPQRAVRSRVPESVAAIPPQGFRSPSNRYPLKTISKPCRRLGGACQGNERVVFLLGVCPSQEKRPSRAATLRPPVSVAARLSLFGRCVWGWSSESSGCRAPSVTLPQTRLSSPGADFRPAASRGTPPNQPRPRPATVTCS